MNRDGGLVGVMTERALARRYVRESREASRLDAETTVAAIVTVLEGNLIAGDHEQRISGRVWVQAMDVRSPTRMEAGDVVVVGDRPDIQRRAVEHGAGMIVTSNDTRPPDDVLGLARERGVAVVGTSLDSYVSARMITLAAPCHALMDAEPLTVRRNDLVADIAEEVKDPLPRGGGNRLIRATGRPRRARSGQPGAAPRAARRPRRVGPERSWDRRGRDRRDPRPPPHRLDRDTRAGGSDVRSVGSTATLVVERFRQAGLEPQRPTALMLLGPCSPTP